MSAFRTPAPRNEPVLNYAPGSPERAALKAALARMSGETIDIPVVIGGQEFRTGRTVDVVAPHEHKRILAKAHLADPALIAKAVDSAVGGAARLGGHAVRRPGGRVPQGRRPPGRALAPGGERRHDAGPEQDGLPGGNRQRLRADRLLPASTCTSPSGSTRSSRSRRPASGTGWTTGRSRGSSTPSRRSTSRRSAATSPPPRRFSATWPSGSRPPRRCSATGTCSSCSRRRGCRRASSTSCPGARRRCPTCSWPTAGWPASTSPARPRCSSRCGAPSGRTCRRTPATRGWSARPAARTSSWPTRAPTWTRWRWRWCAGPSNTRGRSAAPPRGPTCRTTSGRRCGSGWWR